MKQTDKRFVSLKETLACTRRALSLWHTMIPGLLACKLLQIALSALTGHLSHRERQVPLIRHGCAVPPSPRGRLWGTDCD